MVLTEEERSKLLAALLRMQLMSANEAPMLTALTGGISSLIVRVDLPGRAFCIKQALAQLRVAAEWKAPVERNRAEAKWIQLAMTIVPDSVPRLLAEDAEGASFAMELLDPQAFPVWKSLLRDGHIDPAVAKAVGEILARIHNATADQPEVAREFANDETFHALRLDPYFAAAAKKNSDCAPRLAHLIDVTANTKRALVHGDPSPKNVLVGPRGPVLLDAECAWYGDPAFDLAFALHHLLLKSIWKPAFGAQHLQCFDALYKHYINILIYEPRDSLQARAAALLPALLLARVDGKSPAEYLTDEGDRARVRRFGRRFLLQPAARLSLLRDAWQEEQLR